jgi:hypothetical protein
MLAAIVGKSMNVEKLGALYGSMAITVGTTITGCPPYRPGRALISASGSYLGWMTAQPTAGPHTRPPVGHAQTRSVSGTCRMEECSP